MILFDAKHTQNEIVYSYVSLCLEPRDSHGFPYLLTADSIIILFYLTSNNI